MDIMGQGKNITTIFFFIILFGTGLIIHQTYAQENQTSVNSTTSSDQNKNSTQSNSSAGPPVAASKQFTSVNSTTPADQDKNSTQSSSSAGPPVAASKQFTKTPLKKLEIQIEPEEVVSDKKRVIIIFKNIVEDKDLGELAKYDAQIRKKFKLLPAVAASIDEKSIGKIKALTRVADVFEDTRVFAFLTDSIPQINADQVHSTGFVGNGVNVCVVDTGVDDSHPAINSLIAEYDFVNGDNDATDDHGHGTHVAFLV